MWQPTAPLQNLKARAHLLEVTRAFFKAQDILEVETPVLGRAPVTDPFLAALETQVQTFPNKKFYLQTSPEYYQKRLLAAYGISCYQLGRCFRDDEYGRIHSPEFTMLEWYSLGLNDLQLMDQVENLFIRLVKAANQLKKPSESNTLAWLSQLQSGQEVIQRLSYAEVFQQYLKLDPHQAPLETLQDAASQFYQGQLDRDIALQLLMSEVIEKELKKLDRPVFVYDFPASQAALAQIKTLEGGLKVAARFELYWRGVELANGYHELLDAKEQEARFQADLARRKALDIKEVPIDQNLLLALREGHLPECAGIAMGFDRLVMVLLNESALEKVQSFFEF